MSNTQAEREMLEAAAKACGYPWRGWSGDVALLEEDVSKPEPRIRCPHAWNPRTDDGDCARMEAALSIELQWYDDEVFAHNGCHANVVRFIDHNGDKQAARRLASLRVAAEIGRSMK